MAAPLWTQVRQSAHLGAYLWKEDRSTGHLSCMVSHGAPAGLDLGRDSRYVLSYRQGSGSPFTVAVVEPVVGIH